MITDPKIVNRAEQHYVARRLQVTMQGFGDLIPPSHQEVMRWLKSQDKAPSGAPIIRYRVINMMGNMEVDIGWPVAESLIGTERIIADVLPAGRYASLIYTGEYSGLVGATESLLKWAQENNVHWDVQASPDGDKFGSRFESYITDPGPGTDWSKCDTEIAIRLADNSL